MRPNGAQCGPMRPNAAKFGLHRMRLGQFSNALECLASKGDAMVLPR
jgi:hypothetical protein